MRPGLFRDPAAAFFVRGVAVFRRRSRFGDPGKEENFRSGPAPRARPAHVRPRRVHGRHMFARAACAGRLAPRAPVGSRRIGRRRAAQRVGLRVKFSLLYRRGLVRAPVSLTASCVGACPAGDRSFPRAFARGAARMRADTKRVSVLLYRKGRGFCRAPFRRLRRVSSFRRLAGFIFPPYGGVIVCPPLAAVFSALRAGQYLGQYLVWSFLRICTRRIFPLIVLGSSLTNSTTRGYL